LTILCDSHPCAAQHTAQRHGSSIGHRNRRRDRQYHRCAHCDRLCCFKSQVTTETKRVSCNRPVGVASSGQSFKRDVGKDRACRKIVGQRGGPYDTQEGEVTPCHRPTPPVGRIVPVVLCGSALPGSTSKRLLFNLNGSQRNTTPADGILDNKRTRKVSHG